MKRRTNQGSTSVGPKQAVLYARVSSKEQEREGYSIQAQHELLRRYATENAIHVIREFTDVETSQGIRTHRAFGDEINVLIMRESSVEIVGTILFVRWLNE